MGFKLRVLNESVKFASELNIHATNKLVSPELIDNVLDKTGRRENRLRKLGATSVIWFCIALNLFTDECYEAVLSKLVKGLRYIWRDPNIQLAGKSALCAARRRLGVAPMAELFRQIAKPIADLSTSGAYLFGLRLVAIDGTVENLADTPDLVAFWGRHPGSRGDSAYPQAQVVYLSECCTHVVLDAGMWPIGTDERACARRLLRSVFAGMLVLLDRGQTCYSTINQMVSKRGAHFLGRVSSHWTLKPIEFLPDGSYLAYIYPENYRRRKAGERILVRVIAYTITDPQRPGHGITHRVITSLLDPETAPAQDLVCAYHERWEIEIAIDEIDTHQRQLASTFRSRTMPGVMQEFYALLIAYNAVCSLRLQAAQFAGVDPDRISFIVTVRKLCESIDQFQQTSPRQLSLLFKRLLQDIANEKLQPRRNRSNPRVVKQKMSNFLLKRDQHRNWPQPTTTFREAVQLVK